VGIILFRYSSVNLKICDKLLRVVKGLGVGYVVVVCGPLEILVGIKGLPGCGQSFDASSFSPVAPVRRHLINNRHFVAHFFCLPLTESSCIVV
jgi:hypothetical protein